MEIKWLEDFLMLAEKGSFSRAAESRYVTQSAFSRRIRALEGWLGVELFDRSTYPTRLTKAGAIFRDQAASLLANVHEIRTSLQGGRVASPGTIQIAVPHTLSLTFFPQWWASMGEATGHLTCKLMAGNVHDALMALVEGNADLLLCYQHPQQPVKLDASLHQMLLLGEERMLPYSAPTKQGRPRYSLPGERDNPTPYLGYSPNAYFARMVELVLNHAPGAYYLNRRYETDMAEALKQMCITGSGIAWLPDSAVQRELNDGRLVPAGGPRWGESMQILLFRRKQAQNPQLEDLWRFISRRYKPA
jgi:LysR family transcriptional regulator, hypochlorite-specific transcription factor HypT